MSARSYDMPICKKLDDPNIKEASSCLHGSVCDAGQREAGAPLANGTRRMLFLFAGITVAVIIPGCQQQSENVAASTAVVASSNSVLTEPATLNEDGPEKVQAAEVVETGDPENLQHGGHGKIGRGAGGGRGPMAGMRGDMSTLHTMFDNREKMKRTVKDTLEGAEAITESDDEKIVQLIQEHVPAMEGRVMEDNPLPPMTFHPIFVELIKHAEDYTLEYEKIDKGMKATYRAKDPFVVMLVQEHAKLVSRFIKNGMDEIHKPYTLPNPKNEGETKTEPVNAVPETGHEISDVWRALPEEANSPVDNPTTAAKVELGKKLFFDPRLSLTGTISCNTCHNLMEGGDDGRPSSMGVHGRIGPRNAPTVWNSVFQASQFWDGRSASLEDQAKGPIIAAPEMGMPAHDKAIQRIVAIPGYRADFQEVFDGEEPVTIDNAVKAIAAFERTLITPNSAYDKFVKGDKTAMTDRQVRGMKLFASVGCTECHSGPAFNGWEVGSTTPTFDEFPRNAASRFVSQYGLDQDRGRFDVTQEEADDHHFKVPTLRNITITGPYLHNGAVPTLAETVSIMADTQVGTELTEAEVTEIVAFLSALEGEFPEIVMPRLPSRSGESVVKDQEPAAVTGH